VHLAFTENIVAACFCMVKSVTRVLFASRETDSGIFRGTETIKFH
jgi:hypothetical protein